MNPKQRRIMRRSFKKITISEEFQSNPPRWDKMRAKKEVYMDIGKLDPIIVDEGMMLVDGYCTYLMAKKYETVRRKMKIYKRKGQPPCKMQLSGKNTKPC